MVGSLDFNFLGNSGFSISIHTLYFVQRGQQQPTIQTKVTTPKRPLVKAEDSWAAPPAFVRLLSVVYDLQQLQGNRPDPTTCAGRAPCGHTHSLHPSKLSKPISLNSEHRFQGIECQIKTARHFWEPCAIRSTLKARARSQEALAGPKSRST